MARPYSQKLIILNFFIMKKLFTFCLALCATTALWANFTPAAFSVAKGQYVYFSQGNLQCTLSTDTTWAFAENQYDIIGTDNVTEKWNQDIEYQEGWGYSKNGEGLADKIDMFGWSANNTTAPWGICASHNPDYTLYSGEFVDWGKNMGDGNTWRTLKETEGRYLLNERANATDLRGVVCIKLNDDGSKYTNGLVFLPDNWVCPEGITFTSNNTSYSDNTYTLEDWQKLEAAGAVLLPAAGYRFPMGDGEGESMNEVQGMARYWLAEPYYDSSMARGGFYMGFASSQPGYERNTYDRYFGYAVRLARDVHAVNIVAENGTVKTDKSGALEGETITITEVTPNEGYEFEKMTVTYGDNKSVEVKDDKFTMPDGDVTITVIFKSTTALQNVEMAEIYAENGTIYGAEGMQIFTITGQNVTEMNGQLNGVYIVKVGNAAQKIVVR